MAEEFVFAAPETPYDYSPGEGATLSISSVTSYAAPPSPPPPPPVPAPAPVPEVQPFVPSYQPPRPPPPNPPYYPPPPPRKKISYAPVVVYLVLVLIWLIFTIFSPPTGNGKWVTVISGLFWALLWALLIYWLCKKGHTGWAWFLALFSLIVWAVVLLLIFLGYIIISI